MLFRSGVAKERFNKEIAQLRAEASAKTAPAAAPKEEPRSGVSLNFLSSSHPDAVPVVAAATGQILWQLDFNDRSVPPAPGRAYKAGDTFCVIQASYALMPVTLEQDGKLVDTCVAQGQMVSKGDIIGWMK